jgi:hypothetical protein
VSEWQPIETAPRDRGLIGYWAYSKWPPGEWSYGIMKTVAGSWVDVGTCDPYLTEPTHWMPLPEPPK